MEHPGVIYAVYWNLNETHIHFLQISNAQGWMGIGVSDDGSMNGHGGEKNGTFGDHYLGKRKEKSQSTEKRIRTEKKWKTNHFRKYITKYEKEKGPVKQLNFIFFFSFFFQLFLLISFF